MAFRGRRIESMSIQYFYSGGTAVTAVPVFLVNAVQNFFGLEHYSLLVPGFIPEFFGCIVSVPIFVEKDGEIVFQIGMINFEAGADAGDAPEHLCRVKIEGVISLARGVE